jgi:hypothetical protein
MSTPYGAVTGAAHSAGTLRDGVSTFQIRISVSPLPGSRHGHWAQSRKRTPLRLNRTFNTSQVGARQIGAMEARKPKVRTSQVRSAQRGLAQEGATQTGFAKVRPRPSGLCPNRRRRLAP